jgi:Glycosyl transferase family 2
MAAMVAGMHGESDATPASWAPIVLFTYDRPDHTRRTLEALAANDGAGDSDLVVYSDGPRTADRAEPVRAVRAQLRSVAGFKSVTVVERDANMGLANSVIAGVSEALTRSSSVIVMEDDLLTARNFLAFMNAALSTYEPRRDIFSVTGYNYPIRIPPTYREDAYLSYRGSSWGWGTWRDRWSRVDWAVSDYDAFVADAKAQELFRRGGNDLPGMLELQMSGQLDSWSIRFDYAHFKHDALCVHPVVSKVQNIGFDGSGVHCTESDDYDVELDPTGRPPRLRPDLAVDARAIRAFDRKFRPSRSFAMRRTSLRRGKRIVRRLVPFAGR